jgi:hypothetical protein
MIPKVRTWRVRYLNERGDVVAECETETINRRFAIWNARDVIGWHPAARVRVSVRCRGCGGYHVGGCSERVRLAVADRWAP